MWFITCPPLLISFKSLYSTYLYEDRQVHEAEYSISVATSRAVSEDSYRDANAREPDCELSMAARGVRPQDAGRAALAGAPHQRPLAPAAAAAQHQHTARRLHAR